MKLLRYVVVGMVAFACCGSVRATEPLHVQIDRLLAAKAPAQVAAVATDAEFLRRAYLDFAGRIPSTTEARAFLSDPSPTKRVALLDALLASPEYAVRMTDQFHVMLMERLGDHEAWTNYLRSSFQDNRPWDRMVKEMLRPEPEQEAIRGAAFFLSKRLENYGQNPVDYPGLVRDVGRMFLGIDVQCAQCHDHLFIDDYKQEDYQGLFAFLGQATLRKDVSFPAVSENLVTQKVAFKSVFVLEEKMTGPRLPGGKEIDIPSFAKGEEYLVAPDKKTRSPGKPKFSPLQVLADELPRRETELFSKNIVNRLWWMLMGRGLVHPLDLHHTGNPASHPELLERLATEMIEHQFDIRWLLREMALSTAYQRSSELPEGVASVPPETYAVYLEKPLAAEQLVASLVQATGGVVAIVTAGPTGSAPSPAISADLRARFLKAYANPPREPEGEHAPSLKGALFLMNDAEVLARFQPRDQNLVERLRQFEDPQLLAEELYLAVLVRHPSAEEQETVREYLARESDRRDQAIAELAWSLVASAEFSVNH